MIVTALRGRLVLSLRHLRVPSCLAAVLSSRRLLTAPHFCCLVAPAGCCVAAGWLLRCLSLRRRLILSSRRRTLVLSLSSHCAALPLPLHASWLLRRLSSRRRTLVLSLSSHCAALSLPRHAGWLLRRLSSHRHLVFSSRRRTLVLSLSSHCAALSLPHRFVVHAGAYWRTTTDHHLLPPPCDVRRARSRGGAPAGTERAASGTMLSPARGLAGWPPATPCTYPVSGSNVHGVVCKQRILLRYPALAVYFNSQRSSGKTELFRHQTVPPHPITHHTTSIT